MTELVLGTAQLGDAYGITSGTRLTDPEVAELLRTAVDAGIRLADTAAGYGDAETRLGSLRPPAAEFGVVTKFALGAGDVDAMIAASTRRLAVGALHGVLLHRVDDVDDPAFPAALRQLRDARDAGRIGRFGVSVYDLDDLERSLAAAPDLDLVQVPGSVVDRRLLDAPLVAELAGRGVEVHVRSVFLQGLLLVAPDRLPPGFDALAPVLHALDAAAADQGTSRLALLLSDVRHPSVAGAVVGATSADELRAITGAWDHRGVAPQLTIDLADELLDPRRWPR